jgi:hypothetical protein
VQRLVSVRGGIQVCRQRIQVSLEDTSLTGLDQHGQHLTTLPRTTTDTSQGIRPP